MLVISTSLRSVAFHKLLTIPTASYYPWFCSALFCSVLFCSALFHSALVCYVLFCSVLFCSLLPCFILFCSVLPCSVPFCSAQFSLFSSVQFTSVLFYYQRVSWAKAYVNFWVPSTYPSLSRFSSSNCFIFPLLWPIIIYVQRIQVYKLDH